MAPRRWITTRAVFDADGRQICRVGYWHAGPVSAAAPMAAHDQEQFAFYSDDAGEATSTIVGTKNTQQTLDVDTTYQARLLIAETNGAGGNFNGSAWEYNHNSGGWTAITTTSLVARAVSTANITNGGDTTQRLGAGSYIATNGWQTDDGTPGNITYAASEECESVLAFQIRGVDVAHGDEVLLRLSGADAYTVNADIDVNKPTAGPAAGLRTLALTGAGV